MVISINRKRLIEERLKQGYSIAELSRLTGVAPVTISGAENGRRTPRPAPMRKLAEALKLDISDVYTISEG